MKIAFIGQEDVIIGLSNAAKQPIVRENLFDYFIREKPQLVISGESGFDRSLFKNVLKHKCELVVIGNEYPEKRFDQLSSRGASPVFIKQSEVVAFDPIRYPVGEDIEQENKICLISNAPNIYEIYHRYFRQYKEKLDVYTKIPIFLPSYKGWPLDKDFYKLRKYQHVYDYDDSYEETHLLYTLLGLNCNYDGTKSYTACKTYEDSLENILEIIQ